MGGRPHSGPQSDQAQEVYKVEFLIRSGHGPEHDLWQDDLSNCPEEVEKYWKSKPASEHLSSAVCF